MEIVGSNGTTVTTITPPSGKRVRITLLGMRGSNFLGVEVRANGVTVLGGASNYLAGLGNSSVTSAGYYAVGTALSCTHQELTFLPDVVVTIYNGNSQPITSANYLVLAYQIEG
jgi:hypothetical protein